MTGGEKAVENCATIVQILDAAKMNPCFEEIDRIYKLAQIGAKPEEE